MHKICTSLQAFPRFCPFRGDCSPHSSLECRLFALLSLLRQVRLNQRNLGFTLDFADFQVSEHGRPSLIAVDAERLSSLCDRFEAVGQVMRLTQHDAVLTTILAR